MKKVSVFIILLSLTISQARTQSRVALVNHIWSNTYAFDQSRTSVISGINPALQFGGEKRWITEIGISNLTMGASELELFGPNPDSADVVVGLMTQTYQNVGLFFIQRTAPKRKWIPSFFVQWDINMHRASFTSDPLESYRRSFSLYNNLRAGLMYSFELGQKTFVNLGLQSNCYFHNFQSLKSVELTTNAPNETSNDMQGSLGTFVPGFRAAIGFKLY